MSGLFFFRHRPERVAPQAENLRKYFKFTHAIAVENDDVLAGDVFDQTWQVPELEQRRGFAVRHTLVPGGLTHASVCDEQAPRIKTQLHRHDLLTANQITVDAAATSIAFDLIRAAPIRTHVHAQRAQKIAR